MYSQSKETVHTVNINIFPILGSQNKVLRSSLLLPQLLMIHNVEESHNICAQSTRHSLSITQLDIMSEHLVFNFSASW